MHISRKLLIKTSDFLHFFQIFRTSQNEITNNSPHVSKHVNNDLFLAARPT